jgi:hypothetical protein
MLAGLLVLAAVLWWFLPRPQLAPRDSATRGRGSTGILPAGAQRRAAGTAALPGDQTKTVVTVIGGHLERDRQMWPVGFRAAPVMGRPPPSNGRYGARPLPQDFALLFAIWQHGPESFVRQNGGRFLADVGLPSERVDIDNPRTLEALWFIYEITIIQGCQPSNLLTQGLTGNVKFIDGHVAMVGPYAVFSLIDMRDQVRNFDWDVAPLPKAPDGTRASLVLPFGLAVSSQCRHPEAALEPGRSGHRPDIHSTV